MSQDNATPSLKLRTARTLKWNTIDRFATQVLYALVGLVLANVLPQADFGVVGVLLVFQAFAILFVDSGFGAALLQRKEPTEEDYCTVFWFNLGVSLLVYAILYFCAPVIAHVFHDNLQLIPLSRVMFLTFVLNGLSIVQTNRLMKRMDVKMVAVANVVALTVSGAVGIALALTGFGPWALVWQSVVLAGVKSAWLWITGGWLPRKGFYITSLKKIWRVGLSVFSSSALNTLCLNIYSFIIGIYYNFSSLGVYTQADKWSKMGSASISQILTSSFVPLLSKFQDEPDTFHRYVGKINRFTAFILFPVMLGVAAVGMPLFHTLFGTKWDEAIPLFQILMVRGIFIVLISLYSNYLLSLGYARRIFSVELIKDALIIGAIFATIWFGSVEALVWGQLAASVITYIIVLLITSRAIGYNTRRMTADLLPSLLISLVATASALALLLIQNHLAAMSPRLSGAILLAAMLGAGCLVYLAVCRVVRLPELKEALGYAAGRFRNRKS